MTWNSWYLDMSVLAKTLFWIAVVASVLLVIQIIILLISFGGAGDLDGSDLDGDMDTDGGLSFFTVKGITAFFALGGWCGFATSTYLPDNTYLPIIIAVVTGVVALVGVGFAMKGIAKLQCAGNIVKENFKGLTATVYVSIPAGRAGRGKITLTAQGKYLEIDAVTDESERIMVDERVVIESYTDDFAVVARYHAENVGIAEENKEN